MVTAYRLVKASNMIRIRTKDITLHNKDKDKTRIKVQVELDVEVYMAHLQVRRISFLTSSHTM